MGIPGVVACPSSCVLMRCLDSPVIFPACTRSAFRVLLRYFNLLWKCSYCFDRHSQQAFLASAACRTLSLVFHGKQQFSTSHAAFVPVRLPQLPASQKNTATTTASHHFTAPEMEFLKYYEFYFTKRVLRSRSVATRESAVAALLPSSHKQKYHGQQDGQCHYFLCLFLFTHVPLDLTSCYLLFSPPG